MKAFARVAVYLLLISSILAGVCVGQVALGTPPFSSIGGGPFDQINLGNLNVHFAIPILHKAGRAGTSFLYDLSYDNSVWYPAIVGGSKVWQPINNGSYWGWIGLSTTNMEGNLTYSTTVTTMPCGQNNQGHVTVTTYSNYIYGDENGSHPFIGFSNAWLQADSIPNCPLTGPQPAAMSVVPAPDGSGLTLYSSPGSTQVVASVATRSGMTFGGVGMTSQTDANGNEITLGSGGVYTDTLGQTALTVSGTPPSNTTLTYMPPSGAPTAYTASYATYTVETNFGCSGISEYNVSNISLVNKITLPDGSAYSFTYEPTKGGSGQVTGRLASVTLPTGGVITYTYPFTNGGATNGINCDDGSAPQATNSMTRVLTPGGTWTYARNQPGGTGTTHWTTTVTDPSSNQQLIDFQQDAPGGTNNFRETDRAAYNGSVGGTLMLTTTRCYNNHLANCATTPVSTGIVQTDVYTTPPGKSASLSETFYNGYGLPTDHKNYDFGASTPTQDATTVYANLAGIADHPASVTATDGSGNVLAETAYTYDEGTPTSTSGTPQHTAPTGARGNLTTVSTFTSSAGRLTKHFSYYDTGTINQSTDVNGAVTTYGYSTGSCGNSFPTSVTLPVSGLSTSTTWNCVGGVQTGTTDLNGHSTSVTYTDANYWRPAHSLDQASSQTNYSYKTPLKTEVYMSFNGNTSMTDSLTMNDGFGRILTAQKRQSPTSNNYDTVETTYDTLGRASTVTMPYQGTAYQLTSTAPVTTTTYDALNRVLKAQDANGGYVQHTYTGNDDLQISGPAPTGENLKERQMEYDGLGRLTSVCEVTQGTGHIPCGQTNGLNGYLTTYTYSFVTPNVKVSVSQSGQGRTYLYDLAGRLVSETNPENGTTLYDFDSAPDCSGNYAGDLVERKDAKGNISCYTYDSLHRVLSVNYSGPDSANSPAKNFVYDSATVNGGAMANAKGQLAEAYTGTSGSKTTDEGFVYSVLGQVVEVWEKTPHSSTYYHPTASYWNNGALKSVWISSLPTISYGADGEGRTSTVSASSGQNPVTATSYNVSSQVTGVTYGSADSDSYGFDPNSGRVTQYKFNVSAQSVTGNTTWNPNGSLKQLAITNQLNAADTQTCNYTHDDLARIATANCGSIWNQTFTYDAFGNIKKAATVGISFQPDYSSSTNQIATLPGITPTTDADGRMTYDGTHNYAWDVEGKMVTVDATTLTHDALGRMVEKSVSGTITEFVYGPLGSKFAQMSGTTLQKAFVPLPTGTAVYTGTGLSYYRHTDHLGSSRFATTTTRTMYSSTAYAPFGEPYAQAGTTDLSFAGDDQDMVTGINDALFRKLVPVQGRWLSPDPAGLGAADPTNPQSWNRYAYVLNNPMANVDPLGLDCVSVSTDGGYELAGGDCGSDQANGYYVDGAVTDVEYNSETGALVIGYNPSDGGDNQNIMDPHAVTSVLDTSPGCAGICIGNVTGTIYNDPNAGYSSSSSGGGWAANNGTPPPKNPCVADALKEGARNVGIDLLGFLPEAGGVARVVGHQAGYVGKVADNLGKNMLTAGTKTTGTLASAINFSSSDWTTWVSAGITAADFVPVLSDFATPVAIAWDAGVTAYKVHQCHQ